MERQVYNKDQTGLCTLVPWNFLSNKSVFVIHDPAGSHLRADADKKTQDEIWSPERSTK